MVLVTPDGLPSPSRRLAGTGYSQRFAVYSDFGRVETFDLFGVKVGVVICFEGFRFAHATRECVAQGAQLIFHPQNNTTRPNDWKIPVHHAMIVTRAALPASAAPARDG